MKYYWLTDREPLHGLVLRDVDENDKIHIRSIYEPFCCKMCHKPRELECLEGGLPRKLKFKSQADFASSDDDFYLMSSKMVGILKKESITGVRIFSLPDDLHYNIVWPSEFVSVKLKASTFDFHGKKCPLCGRCNEVTANPISLKGFSFPSDDLTLFSPEVTAEGKWGKRISLYASEIIVRRLKPYKLKGLYFHEASSNIGRLNLAL